jgi:hypothetical protein
MVRRNSGWIAAGVCALAMATGCGGTSGDDLFPPTNGHATTVVGFGAAHAERVYYGLTNPLAIDGRPTLATFELTAGSRVELEIATRDGSPLVFELHRVRRDGTTELLDPVHATSGFHLGEIEASSTGTFVLYFPAADAREVTVLVHMDCRQTASRCAVTRQPGEACTQAFPCDEGLTCATSTGRPVSLLGEGSCYVVPAVPPIP